MSDQGQDPNSPDEGSLPPPPSGPPSSGLPPPPGGQGGAMPPPQVPSNQWGQPTHGAPYTPAGGGTLAGPWARVGARVIDGLIMAVVSVVLLFAFIDVDSTGVGFQADVNAGHLLASVLIGIAYEVGFVGALGGTPGKLMLGLRIVTQDAGVSPPGWDRAGLRYLPSLAGLLPLVGWIASFAVAIASLIWIFSDDQRRSVFDRVATTHVVKV